jgi:hypothetical protein
MFLPALAFSAIPFLETSFCEMPGLIRRVPSKPDPIWEAGEKGVLLATKRHKRHEEGGVKYEARNPKSETNSNDRNTKFKTN